VIDALGESQDLDRYDLTGTNQLSGTTFPVTVTATEAAPLVLAVQINSWRSDGTDSIQVVVTLDLDRQFGDQHHGPRRIPAAFDFDVTAHITTGQWTRTVTDGGRYSDLRSVGATFDLKSEASATRYHDVQRVELDVELVPAS
jgi:hypothetical protein